MEFDSVSAPESQATAPGNGNAVSDVVSVAVAAAPGAAAASKPTSQVTPSDLLSYRYFILLKKRHMGKKHRKVTIPPKTLVLEIIISIIIFTELSLDTGMLETK